MKRFAIGTVAAALLCVLAGSAQAQAGSALIGGWHHDGVVQGQKAGFGMALDGNGAYAIVVTDRGGNVLAEVEGEYTYKNNVLTLYTSDGDLFGRYDVTWVNRDHFVLDGVEHWSRVSN
jgi:hypothetical protein